MILASGNLWNGAAVNYTPAETACRIACMLCVGFLEEVIFRGLLFKAIARDNTRSAIVISSVTFGIGHIINLFNGSGMDLVNNLCQIVFAIAVGFLLVTIFYRGGSLIPCILVHSAINMLGTFANDAELTAEMQLLHIAALIAITVTYTLILTRTLPKNDGRNI
ncbi:MAG: CPBP family intramembrane glutamic endopeptidase [Candidatus Faecivicinus sp.]|nr:CPBP family intramembrane glutamic endopeptidase [Candidatus Faecivicinus sp.]